jgi:hypothetical protein
LEALRRGELTRLAEEITAGQYDIAASTRTSISKPSRPNAGRTRGQPPTITP